MAAFIELIAKIKQKNNGTFKLVDAQDVECEDGKGLDEVLNEKLDKNQGIENAGKTMIVGDDGNLVVGDSSPKNVYTKEEVDYMLADKMDKPYVPIEITDNVTITDALAGNFKINKIKGNTYQNVEENIVPTPQRPVPINSRKTTITKINPNIFDFEKENDTSKIPDSGTYRSIRSYQLKPDTQYIFSWSSATVPAKGTLSFQIQNNTGTVLVSPFTYFNISSAEKEETGKDVKFTTTSSGIIKFAYNCTVATSSTTETYQQYWYTKILKDISLKEDVEYEPEYVELRSLKETGNLFDKNIMAFTFGTLKFDGTVDTSVLYAVSGFVPVRPSTQYTIKVIDGFRGSTKVYYDINKQVILNEAITTFTTPSNCYFVRWQTATTDTRVLTEEDIQKINDEMMMVKGDSLPSSYVPPTVRDYKIVDHTAKTAKIVRNVNQFELPTDFSWNYTDYYPSIIGNVIPEDKKGVYDTRVYNLINYTTEPYFGYSNISGIYLGFSECDTYWGLNNSDEVNAFLTRIKEDGKPFLFQYQLAMPVEETITYVETDTSEVGYSWQDTTSPSPTIPAEVKGVEEIDILKTGKNLLNIVDYNKLTTNGITSYMSNDGSIKYEGTSTANYVRNVIDNLFLKKGFYTLKKFGSSNYRVFVRSKTISSKVYVSSSQPSTTFEIENDDNVYLYCSIDKGASVNDIFYPQIEAGNIETAYEPYQSQQILITPPQPLYENDIVNVESGNYEYEDEKYIVTGDEVFYQDYQVQPGYYGRYFLLNNSVYDDVTTATKCYCNMLTYIQFLWGKAYEGVCQNINKQIHLKFTNDRLGVTDDTPVEEKRLAFANYLKQLYASENPLYVVVKVAKTTQPIPPEDLTKIKSLKTEQGVTNIFVGGEVKPIIEARYPRDLALVQQQLEQKILLISDSLIDTQAKVLWQGGDK